MHPGMVAVDPRSEKKAVKARAGPSWLHPAEDQPAGSEAEGDATAEDDVVVDEAGEVTDGFE